MTSDIFQDEFKTVVKAFCSGIKGYPGEVHDSLVHILIQDLEPMFVGALERGLSLIHI